MKKFFITFTITCTLILINFTRVYSYIVQTRLTLISHFAFLCARFKRMRSTNLDDYLFWQASSTAYTIFWRRDIQKSACARTREKSRNLEHWSNQKCSRLPGSGSRMALGTEGKPLVLRFRRDPRLLPEKQWKIV